MYASHTLRHVSVKLALNTKRSCNRSFYYWRTESTDITECIFYVIQLREREKEGEKDEAGEEKKKEREEVECFLMSLFEERVCSLCSKDKLCGSRVSFLDLRVCVARV